MTDNHIFAEWERSDLLELRPFFKRRAKIYKRLINAAALSTAKRKKHESYKPLEKSVKTLKRAGIKLIDVAHLIAYAEQSKGVHDNIIGEHKLKRKQQRDAKNAYFRKIGRIRKKLQDEYRKFNFQSDADDIFKALTSEAKIEGLFSPQVLGRLSKATAEKDQAKILRDKYTKGKDTPVEKHLNKFCKNMEALFDENGWAVDYTLIANLINAFSLSPKKQSYHTIHNRLTRINK